MAEHIRPRRRGGQQLDVVRAEAGALGGLAHRVCGHRWRHEK
jgi:hypothetical protein